MSHKIFFLYQIAAEVAAPLSQAKKITMISSGKGDVGAAKLTSEVLEIVEKMPGVVQSLTGVDIAKVYIFYFGFLFFIPIKIFNLINLVLFFK